MTLPLNPSGNEDNEGYAWLEKWVCPFEGPFSAFSKFCDANFLDWVNGYRVCFQHEQGKRYGTIPVKSLLDMRWTSANEPDGPRAAQMRGLSLQEKLPRIWSLLASERAMRYCPSCAEYSYQAAVAQIDGLVHCPIHGERHLDACQHCGKGTDPYVLSRRKADNAWICAGCQMPYGGTAQMQTLCRWRSPPGVERLAPIHSWLKLIDAAEPQWPDLPFWAASGPAGQRDSGQARRSAAFEVFAHLIDPPGNAWSRGDSTLDVQSWTVDRQVLAATEELGTEKSRAWETSLYDALAQELSRSGNVLDHSDVCQRARTCLVPVCESVDVRAHALTIWRRQFERSPSSENFALGRYEAPHLRDSDTVWTTARRSHAYWPDYRVHSFLWAEFLTRSWDECVWIAEQWHAAVKEVGNAFGHSTLSKWLPEIDRWIAFLDHWPNSRFSPITSLVIGTGASDKAIIAVASTNRRTRTASQLQRSVLECLARSKPIWAEVSSLESNSNVKP